MSDRRPAPLGPIGNEPMPAVPTDPMEKLQVAVKKLIKDARRSGIVTLSQINEILPTDAASPEQIEYVMQQIEEAGIDIGEESNAKAGSKQKRSKSSGDDPFEALVADEDDEDDNDPDAGVDERADDGA
ncbi:MAG: RNA polymerase sigma factor region1.1 domain-containing protein, partial [Planctomycetota bacterium]